MNLIQIELNCINIKGILSHLAISFAYPQCTTACIAFKCPLKHLKTKWKFNKFQSHYNELSH